jgi:hypothetical protein
VGTVLGVVVGSAFGSATALLGAVVGAMGWGLAGRSIADAAAETGAAVDVVIPEASVKGRDQESFFPIQSD